jgi:single-stranded-DNA-specific exonuclease
MDYDYDAEIETDDIDLDLAEAITWLEPCGRDNELPVFAVRNAEISDWRYLKGENRMAKFSIATEGERSVECLLFHDAAEAYDSIKEQSAGGSGAACTADILGTVEINRWRDETHVQMIAKYVLPAGTLK